MAQARFRCYAELNDFLPHAQRQQDIRLSFRAPAPVRHLMETLGVPHTEVELVLINGKSLGLDHLVQDGDQVSLYPMFEAMDVSSELRIRAQPLRKTRFLVDAHLGRLARYLRLLGFDTLFENDWGDATLARIAREDHRILLTRDRALLMRRAVTHGCYVRAISTEEQLAYVVKRLDLFGQLRPFTRCTLCNGVLSATPRDKIADLLPEGIGARFRRFWQCAGCGKLYWQGGHYQRLRQRVENLIAQGDDG